MIPRSQVDWLTPETTLVKLRELMASGHTRYPVIHEDTLSALFTSRMFCCDY